MTHTARRPPTRNFNCRRPGSLIVVDHTELQLGTLPRALKYLAEGIEVWQQHRNAVGTQSFSVHPAIAILCNHARALWFAGLKKASQRTIAQAIRVAESTGHQRTLAYALAIRSNLDHLRGDAIAALEHSTEAAALASKQELPYELAWAELVRTWAVAQTGDGDRAAGLFESILSRYQGPCLPKFLCHYSSVLMTLNRRDEASDVLRQAFDVSASRKENYYLGPLYTAKGWLVAGRGRLSNRDRRQAVTAFRKGVEVARQQKAKNLEHHAILSWVRFAEDQYPQDVKIANDALSRVTRELAALNR